MSKRPCTYLLAGALAVTCFTSASTIVGAAAEPATVLLLDRDALDHGPPPHPIPGEAVNDLIADIGIRDQLPYFAANTGQPLTLLGGQNGSDAWFALTEVPQGWSSEQAADDGLRNYLLAGPGLGSPDATGARDTLLYGVPNVQPLRTDGLRQLTGHTVCAVVYDSNVEIADATPPTADLNGPTLGITAFQVLAVDDIDGSAWPKVEVQILDARKVCGGELQLLTAVP